MLEKPTEYQEVSAQQNEKTVYAEDINQIITNVEKLKGGQANEAPVSNIKDLHSNINELKEKLNGAGTTLSADKIAFNNDNANLDFSDGYDFPPFKNKLKDSYNITLVTNDYFNSLSHIDNAEEVYELVLEKSTDKYILKGTLIYNNTYSSNNLIFPVIAIQKNGEEKNNDVIYIVSELAQFIYKYTNASDNEIVIEGLNRLKYNFGMVFGVPMFVLAKQDSSNFEAKKYTININIEIPINNIRNYQEFIAVQGSNDDLSFLKAYNKNEKIVFAGQLQAKVGDAQFLIFGNLILENYFDIKTDQNDSYYIEANNNITSNKNKSLKYYIRKEITDGSELSPIYANIPITFYYLEIKHSDNSKIEYNEILTFNLTAPKNADVPKIEKEANIQNAIEILSSQIKYLMLNLGIGSSKTYFEKTEIDIEAGGEVQHITAEALEDVSGLYLEKKYDGSYYIKGSIKAGTTVSRETMCAVRVKAESLEKSKLRTMINDYLNGIVGYFIYKDNYIYFIFRLLQIGEDRYKEINEYKIYYVHLIMI
ncbi:hypothetical protein [Brachyspira intermedia]|uniref:hypothetical protein n=1 Tax=Brachyspira intermedia TaxID=84377 RepID=UPI003004D9CF